MLSPSQRTNRRFMKIERIVRLELSGYSDVEIAMVMGITKQYVSMLRRTPEFVSIRTQVASGVLEQLDNDLDESIKMSQEQLKASVPNAVLILRSTMLDPNLHPRLRFDAAKEICDREGTFAKVSKSEVREKKEFSFNTDDAITQDLLAALQNNSKKHEIEGSKDFVSTPELDGKTQEKLNLSLEELPVDSKAIN